jgi:thioredoxin 1
MKTVIGKWVLAACLGFMVVGCEPAGPQEGFVIPEGASDAPMPPAAAAPATGQAATGGAVPAKPVSGPGSPLSAENFAGTDVFDQISASDTPVIVDFTATWCGPCQKLKPILHELESEGKVKVVMVDVDQHPGVAEAFGVTGIPHLVFVKDGKFAESSIGLQPKEKLEDILGKL